LPFHVPRLVGIKRRILVVLPFGLGYVEFRHREHGVVFDSGGSEQSRRLRCHRHAGGSSSGGS
jgi:hypothetical protein